VSDYVDKPDEDVPFLRRWSQRKHQQLQVSEPQTVDEPAIDDYASTDVPINKQELPPIESLHEDSEVSMFLGEGISETLKRQALRKLFHLGKFNICDGLDDYAEDYTIFEKLDVVLDTQKQLKSMYEHIHPDANEFADAQAGTEEAQDEIAEVSYDASVPDATESTDDEETKPG